MTNEEVLAMTNSAIELIGNNIKYYSISGQEFCTKKLAYYKSVKEVLEKQTPKKVEGHRDCCSYKFYKCPSCKTDLIMRSQYCDKCGQRLEWQNDK